MSTSPVWLPWVARWVIGITLLLSGSAKARDLPGFARGVADYRLLPDSLNTPFAVLVALTELAVGALLIAGRLAPWPAIGALLLFGLFALAIVINLLRGREVPCYCMGASSREQIGIVTLVRLAVLAVLSWLAIQLGPSTNSLVPAGMSVTQLIAFLSLVAHGTVLLFLLGPFGLTLGAVVKAHRALRAHAKAQRGRTCEHVVQDVPLATLAEPAD